jgi:hypothetical protein
VRFRIGARLPSQRIQRLLAPGPVIVFTAVPCAAKPAVPEPPTLERAYKDELFLNLGLLEAGCTRIVEYAVTPAILYYTWVKIADEEVTATTAHVTGLKPESSIVTRVTVRNSAGSATSATSGFFTTLSEAADRDVRLKEARDAASTARSDYDRVYAEVTALRTRIAELEVAASGSDSAKSARIAQLESELAKLRTELPEALARIETQKREIKTCVSRAVAQVVFVQTFASLDDCVVSMLQPGGPARQGFAVAR